VRHYVRGVDVYPSPIGAADYPPELSREVAKANRLSELAVYTPIALGHADPVHLFETLKLIQHGEVSLGIYRASEGYTKTASYGDEGGHVHTG
jgi:hypothetical protein